MTIQDFNKLSQYDKETVIFEQSEFLHVETLDGLKYGLYAKDKFFIEVICYEESLAVRECTAFDSGKLIDNKFIQQELDDIASYIDNNQCTVDYQLLDNMTLHAHPSLFKALFNND